MAEKIYENVTITPKEHSEIEITGEITVEATEKYRKKAIKNLGNNAEIPGFRKGHIPENILVQKLGEPTILDEVAEMALADAYPGIVLENKLHVIGRPKVTITKLAPGNPIGFKVETTVMPEVILPNYKKIAEEITKTPQEDSAPTEKEVADVLLQIRKNKWQIDNKNISEKEKKEPEEKDLPELTDDLVKTLGDFKDVADFTEKLKENMRHEKETREKSKWRAELGEKLIEKTEISLPRILVDHELEKMLGQFKHDVAAMGMPFDDYLKKINKTEDDLRNEWKTDAEKRAKLQLTLNNIATKENIVPDKDEVEREEKRLLENHKDADPESVRVYVTTLLTNEKIFKFLENQKTAQNKDYKG